MQDDERYFVRKIGNIERNLERYRELAGVVPFPKIYDVKGDQIDMEYIHGLDVYSYLELNQIDVLTNFIITTMNTFQKVSIDKDYIHDYNAKLGWVNDDEYLPFTKDQLIERLPRVLPQSWYHGDMTLENIICTDTGFVFIDPLTSEYDSYIFDIAKMRQDTECYWFMRKKDLYHQIKLKEMQNRILTAHPLANNDNLLILMLLRVYRNCTPETHEHQFILNEVNRLWK